MRTIDADALYEKTAEWEAQALAHIEELNRTPLEEMTVEERAEWRRWTAILGERSAFKHDIADAPTIKAEMKDCKKCKSHMAFLMAKMAYDDRRAEPKHGRWKHHQYGNTAGYYECDNCGKINSYKSNYCPKCGVRMDGGENGKNS